MSCRTAFSAQALAVLAALAAQPSAWRHGYDLARETGLKSGTLYPILVRLADRKIVQACWEDGEPAGRPRRHLYRLTSDGLAAGTAALLPLDPDRSARRIREGLEHRYGVTVGVIISDTFGRAWRRGVCDVAIGVAGIAGIVDLRGKADANGRILESTEVCVADELAGAAELVMGKDRGIPAAVLRGVEPGWLRTASVATEIVRPPGEDLFR